MSFNSQLSSLADITASYDPADNKLRIRSVTRLDSETYARLNAAGFIWAPKQKLLVAPMWTPERADLCEELAGEIGDEDTSLVERAERRAERFEDYSDARRDDAEFARKAVSAIADHIPLGQPILVGHHSERHARKDAEKIENGMRRAVKMWETSQYWQARAKGALRNAKYKELPAVRARRIKGLEADRRKHERHKAEANGWLALWSTEGLTLDQARAIADRCWLRVANDGVHTWTAYDVLRPDRYEACPVMTVEQVQEIARKVYPELIAQADRWISHISLRLEYEKAMLEESGASSLLEKKKLPPKLPLCNYRAKSIRCPNRYHRGEFLEYSQVEMTSAKYAAIHRDYKGTNVCENSHRVRTAIVNGGLVCVFLTDSKTHQKPEPVTAPESLPKRLPEPVAYAAPERTEFDSMRETLKAGVQVVAAPQLFPTPPEVARRVVELAQIEPGHFVLEPSAGTGALIRAMRDFYGSASVLTAVEINSDLCHRLKMDLGVDDVRQADFLTCNGNLGLFDRIVMNPPFAKGADIAHITHARTFLKPGGKIVAWPSAEMALASGKPSCQRPTNGLTCLPGRSLRAARTSIPPSLS